MVVYPFKSAHNPKVRGSNPLPATNEIKGLQRCKPFFVSPAYKRFQGLQSFINFLIKCAFQRLVIQFFLYL